MKVKSLMGVLVGAAAFAYAAQAADAAAAKLPQVLIIGDSISIGYTPFVQAMLTNKADVVHAPGNNGATLRGLESIDAWLGSNRWDVIHFNWGLHDLKYVDAKKNMTDVSAGKQWVSVAEYEQNLRTLVGRLKKTGARLVWGTTTPVPAGAKGRVPGDEVKYNAAALRVMQSEGVPVDDLCAFVGTPQNRDAMGGRPKDVHYTEAGSKALAGEVAKAITKALAK